MEEFSEQELKNLKASKKNIEINIALSGLEGEKIQKLAHLLIQERLNILEELSNENIGKKIIAEELQDFQDAVTEKNMMQTKLQNEKIAYLNNYHKEQNANYNPQDKINSHQITEHYNNQLSEFKELKSDLKKLHHLIVKPPKEEENSSYQKIY
ncbi:hypothetical protein PPERSA_01205 [Pseudocohnilembus persalinus]|uniref:Uncharacterized protein n=1 Tax=Pseudocohnilembus persalinus TaxID=266149 RepID=A0A0V0QBT8_PSEPJ|nr:hypothetical protein PPERSA_01205 [Pseudocohnilembus persalinus]|eukprot:KRW99559.1 hypothetical protein PPERSA_01205 [Pseudocohnilembus persalinus]